MQDLALLALLVVPVQRRPRVVHPLRAHGLAAAQHPQAQHSSVQTVLLLHFWLLTRHGIVRASTPSTLEATKSGATEEFHTKCCAHRTPPRIKHITLVLCSFPTQLLEEREMEKNPQLLEDAVVFFSWQNKTRTSLVNVKIRRLK